MIAMLTKYLPYLGLLAIVVAFRFAFVDLNNVLLHRDIGSDFLVHKSHWAKVVKEGEIPIWTHEAGSGTPFLAQVVFGVFHPLNLLFLLFPKALHVNVMTFYIILHYFFIYAAFYFLLRIYLVEKTEATLFAVAFTCSGPILSLYNLPHILAGFAAVPFFFACLKKWDDSKLRAWWIGAAVAMTYPLLSGTAQTSYLLGLVAVLLAVRALFRKDRLQAFNLGVLLPLVALGLSAVQWLPTLDVIQRSSRGWSNLSISELEEWSYHPLRLFEVFIPNYFGQLPPPQSYWGKFLINFSSEEPYIHSTYLGAFLCSCFGVFIFRQPLNVIWSSFVRYRWLVLAAFVLFLIVLGKYAPLPLNAILIKVLPGWSAFRYPVRLWPWLCLVLFFLGAKLFAATVNSTSQQVIQHNKSKLICCALMLAALICFSVAFAYIHAAMSIVLLPIAIAIMLIGLFSYGLLNKQQSFYLVLLLFLDIAFFSNDFFWYSKHSIAKADTYFLPFAIHADLAKRTAALEQGAPRRYTSSRLPNLLIPKTLLKKEFGGHIPDFNISGFEKLAPNIAPFFGIESADFNFTLLRKNYLDLWDRLQKTNNEILMDLLAVYYMPDRPKLIQPKLQFNQDALPYFYIAEKLQSFANRSLLLDELQTARPPLPLIAYQVNAENKIVGKASLNNFIQKKLNYRFNGKFQFSLSAVNPITQAIFVMNENFDPNWKAYLNGLSLKVIEVNGWAVGIVLPSLEQEKEYILRLEYQNKFFTIGFWLSISTVAFLIFIFFVNKRFLRVIYDKELYRN